MSSGIGAAGPSSCALLGGKDGLGGQPAANVVLGRKWSASRPWLATCTILPNRRS